MSNVVEGDFRPKGWPEIVCDAVEMVALSETTKAYSGNGSPEKIEHVFEAEGGVYCLTVEKLSNT